MRMASMVLATALAIGALQSAQADQEVFKLTSRLYRDECGSCHVAYPPPLLPNASWAAIMDGLDKHFGTDATVDASAAKEIQAYLEANAGRRRMRGKPPLRITGTPRFREEHDEVPASTWKSPAVKSAANCGACHTRAESGDY